MNAEELPTVDGRRARRDQNRERVVDALLEIYREGDLQPSVATVAERSGVSHRSVFRYFDDLDELHRVSIERQLSAVSDLLRLSNIGKGPLGERIDQIVEARLQIYDTEAPVARVGRMLAPTQPVLAANLRKMAAVSVDQVEAQFAAEFMEMDVGAAASAREAISACLSMDSLEFLSHVRGLDRDQTRDAVRAVLRGVLSSAK